MQKIILTGNPISTNHIYKSRGKHVYMTEDGKQLKRDYQILARSQYRGKPLEGDIRVKVNLFFGNKLRRDWDNWHKISMDALTKIVWNDDSQIKEATVIMGYDKGNPRIEIAFEPIGL